MTPRDLGLPFDAYREGQWEAAVEVVKSPKKFTIIEAPTGSGKGVLALSGGRLLQMKWQQEHEGIPLSPPPVYVNTATRQLQDQYLETSWEIRKVDGKQNHRCLVNPLFTAEEAICTEGQHCPHYGTGRDAEPGCTYFDQLREALGAAEVAFNYPALLADLTWTRRFSRPQLLVCDEAHTLETQLAGFVSVTLPHTTLAALKVPFPPYTPGDWRSWQRWAIELAEELVLPPARSGLFRRASKLKRDMQTLGEQLTADWIVRQHAASWEFVPSWVDHIAHRYLFRHADKVVLMSATVRPLDLFCDLLGIELTDCDFVSVPSTFPVAQRPLFYQPVGRLRHGDTAVLDPLAERIDSILELHEGEKGLVHTVSFDLAKAILARTRYPGRFITHTSSNRSQMLERFKATPDPMVLLSPSMGTGVDLPYELCRFNVLTKIPFLNLGDDQVQRRMAAGPRGTRWYTAQAAWSLQQAYGRGMRAQDDYCATYLLDGVWDRFKQRARTMLSPYFMDAIQEGRRQGQRTLSIDRVLEMTI